MFFLYLTKQDCEIRISVLFVFFFSISTETVSIAQTMAQKRASAIFMHLFKKKIVKMCSANETCIHNLRSLIQLNSTRRCASNVLLLASVLYHAVAKKLVFLLSIIVKIFKNITSLISGLSLCSFNCSWSAQFQSCNICLLIETSLSFCIYKQKVLTLFN